MTLTLLNFVVVGEAAASAFFAGAALWFARKASAAANRSDASCRQAALYHDPPNLFAAVRRAEAAAAKVEGREPAPPGMSSDVLTGRLIATLDRVAESLERFEFKSGTDEDPMRDAGLE